MKLLISALAILIAAGTAAAAPAATPAAAAAGKTNVTEKPNFSGQWTMNAAKNNFGQLPPPSSFVRKIEHVDPALTIVENQTAGGADSTTARKLATDGKTVTLELNGFAAACSAVWDGKDIIATTNLDSAGVKFTDRMSLSPDGKTLTSKVQIASAQGDGEVTIVFDRQ